jgi:mediator of RNA polymerase II transcription subunit 21
MSDKLSQLQDQVNYLASLFCDATGILQSQAKPSKFENFAENLQRDYEEDDNNKPPIDGTVEDMKVTFAELITNTAKNIDDLIDSLPNEDESNESLQAEQLKQLEIDNKIAARQLEHVTNNAEELLKQIQDKISKIAQVQLESSNKND